MNYKFVNYKQLTHDRTYHRRAFYLRPQDRDTGHTFYNRYIAMRTTECVEPYLMLNLYRMDELKTIIGSISTVESLCCARNEFANSFRNFYHFHCKYRIGLIFHSCYAYLELSNTSCISTLRRPLSSRFPYPHHPWSIEILLYLVCPRWRMNCVKKNITIIFLQLFILL